MSSQQNLKIQTPRVLNQKSKMYRPLAQKPLTTTSLTPALLALASLAPRTLTPNLPISFSRNHEMAANPNIFMEYRPDPLALQRPNIHYLENEIIEVDKEPNYSLQEDSKTDNDLEVIEVIDEYLTVSIKSQNYSLFSYIFIY